MLKPPWNFFISVIDSTATSDKRKPATYSSLAAYQTLAVTPDSNAPSEPGFINQGSKGDQFRLAKRRLFVTENTPGTPLAAMYASWLSI